MRLRWLVALALVACTAPEKRVLPDVREIGRDRYLDLVAVGDRVVVARTGPSAAEPGNVFAVMTWELVTPATGRHETLVLPDSVCPTTTYVSAFPIDSSRVGFVRECGHFDDVELLSYDVTARRAVTLVPAVAATPLVARLGDDDYLASYDSSYCTHLTRYRRDGVVPLGITLAKDGWPLDANSAPGEDGACRSYGLVSHPAVSPDGVLALVASPAARGKTGSRRVYADRWVYLVDGGVARPLVKAPGHPRALVWSADGSRLYLSVDHRHEGVYAVAKDGTLTLVTSAAASGLAEVAGSLVMLQDVESEDGLTERLVVLPTR